MFDSIKLPIAAAAGALISVALYTLINTVWFLPAAREEGKSRLIAEQAAQAQREELERKGDDAKLQRMSDFDLCVSYLGRVPECDSLKLFGISEE